MKLRKFFLMIFLLSSSLFFVSLAHAAAVPPGKNPMCWSKEWCQKEIEFYGWIFTESNFEMGGPDGVCGSELGVCLPAGQVSTQIKIGENSQFSNIGDYIKKIYNYLIYIGGTVAVVVLLLGGFFWLTSAGNPGRVTAAKGYISGSLIGLVLLLGSYTLLYTINPDLVRLRLPRVYIVRRLSLGEKWCKDLGTKIVAFAGGYTSSIEVPEVAFRMWANPDISDSAKVKEWIMAGSLPVCSLKYFWVGSNDQTCWGHVCEPLEDGSPKICLEEKNEKFTCKPGNLSGTITGSNKFPYIDNNLNLMGVCNSGDNFLAQSGEAENLSANSQSYIFKLGDAKNITNQIEIRCQNDGGIKGYFLAAEINDEPGADDWVAIGQNNGKCNINLSKILFPKVTDGNVFWGCNQVGYKASGKSPPNGAYVPANYLISSQQIKNGFICDIEIGTDFPSINNLKSWLVDDTSCNVSR